MSQVNAFLKALRQATRHQHDQLEQRKELSVLTCDTLTEPDYVQALVYLYQAQRPLELALEQFLQDQEACINFEARYHYIEQDLRALMGESFINDLISSSIPKIKSFSHAAGYLYVLEGSKLGGQFILKSLESSLPNLKHAFFRSADNDAKDLEDVLSNCLTRIEDNEWCVSLRAAEEAFRRFNGSWH